jgi:hypothetical protein
MEPLKANHNGTVAHTRSVGQLQYPYGSAADSGIENVQSLKDFDDRKGPWARGDYATGKS